MITRRRLRPLLLLLLLTVSLPSSTPHSLPATRLPAWTETTSLSTHTRELDVVADDAGIPKLEPGENAAPDPADVVAAPARPATGKNLPPKPFPSAEPDDSPDDPLAPDTDDHLEPSPDSELPEPAPIGADPSLPPERPGTGGLTGSETAVTVPPARGTPTPEQPNSQALLGSGGDPGDPFQSPELAFSDSPSPVPPASPSASSAQSPSPSPLVVGIGIPKPLKPEITVTTAFSPKPSSAAPGGNSGRPEITVAARTATPSPSSFMSPTASSSPLEVETPEPSFLPNPSSSGLPSLSPTSESLALLSPSPTVPTSVQITVKPSTFPSPFGSGVPSLTLSPQPSTSLGVPPSDVPSSSPIPEPSAFTGPPPSGFPNMSPSSVPSHDGTTDQALVTAVPPASSDSSVAPSLPGVPLASSTPSASISAKPVVVTAAPPPAPAQATNPPIPPSPSTSPVITVVTSPPRPGNGPSNGDDEVPLVPAPVDGFTCLFFGNGSFPQLASPDPNLFGGSVLKFSVSQDQFPSLSPQYLSHSYGQSWTYSVPAETNSTYEFVLGFAEIYGPACSSGGGFRQFTASVGKQSKAVDVMDEVGCGKPLKISYGTVNAESNYITASFQAVSQNAMLSTMCYRKVDLPNKSTSPVAKSPTPVPTVSPSQDGIVGPDGSYKCVSFGPKAVAGYLPYDTSAVKGETFIYKGSGITQNPGLPVPYRFHLFGKNFTYSLNVFTDTPQRVVLGFAEVFPRACASGSNASYRVFTVSVANGVRILDVMKSAGCGVVQQIAYESVSPKNNFIDISFAAIAGHAMVSTICFKDVITPSPTVTQEPVPTAIPPAVFSPEASASPEESDPASTGCFKFGDDIVAGFANVRVPDLGAGIEFYRNPFAVVKGTPYNSVYSSHIYGPEFKFSVRTGSAATKWILLGFAEVFQAGCREGFRVFTITAGSTTKTIDVYKEAGCNTAFDLRIDGVSPSASGVVDVSFKAVNNFAMLSAVCIYDDSTSAQSNIRPSQPQGSASAQGFGPNDALDSSSIVFSSQGSTSATSASPSPSPMVQSGKPSLTPKGSPLAKESGEPTPASSAEDEFIDDVGGESQDFGVVPTSSPAPLSPVPSASSPMPSDVLLPSNFSQTTMGSSNEPHQTPSPLASASAISLSDNSFSAAETAEADAADITPSATPSFVVSSGDEGTASESPEASPGVVLSSEGEGTIDESPEESSNGSLPAPTKTPSISFASSPSVPSAAEGSSPSVPTVTPTVSASGGSGTQAVVTAVPPPAGTTSAPGATANPTTTPIVSQSVAGVPGVSTSEPVVTAIPPSQLGSGSATGPPEQPNQAEVSTGAPEATNDGNDSEESEEPIAPTVSLGPSPVQDRQPVEILPPVDSSPVPTPSVTPAVQQSLAPSASPTVTPTLSVPVVSPSPSGNPQSSGGSGATGASPTPNASSGTPSGVVIDGSSGPTVSPTANDNNSTGGTGSSPNSSPAPSPSRVSSTTNSTEVITAPTEGTEAPTPAPNESGRPLAPDSPVSNVPSNETDAIQVTDGSQAENDNSTNPDAAADGSQGNRPTIIAGQFKDLISTKSQGNAFAIGMGVLGSLLVLLLLICLFFAIFRSRGGAYSYSSQYSAHNPEDYDPSQGGYTDDPGPGTGEYGNEYMYGSGAQDGYGGGATFETRPQTQNGSFTYEGATELGGTIGSGSGRNYADGGLGAAEGSAYGNTEPDTFAEYSSLNMQRPSGQGQSQGATTGDYTFNDTFTMPNTGVYPPRTRDIEFDARDSDPGIRSESAQRTGFRASDSFNAHHSMARPTAVRSESSGKQERDSQNLRSSYTGGNGTGSHDEEAALGDRFSDHASEHNASEAGIVRGPSQPNLSMSSNPSVGKSPYESNIYVDVEDDEPGNVYEGNPTFSRALSTNLSGTPVLRGETVSSEELDTEPCNDFLCNDLRESRTGPFGVGDALKETIGVNEATAARSQGSDDGPWPWWWSDRKRVAPVSPVTNAEGDQRTFAVPSTKWGEDQAEDTKENESISNGGIMQSIFQDSEGDDRGTTPRRGVPISPLRASSKGNMRPTKPSHILPDSGWRRHSRSSDKAGGTEHDDFEANPEFEELRRRREPYVKSVANRLSFGPRSYLTSSSGESPLEHARQDYEREMNEVRSGAERTSSSWITQGPIQT